MFWVASVLACHTLFNKFCLIKNKNKGLTNSEHQIQMFGKEHLSHNRHRLGVYIVPTLALGCLKEIPQLSWHSQRLQGVSLWGTEEHGVSDLPANTGSEEVSDGPLGKRKRKRGKGEGIFSSSYNKLKKHMYLLLHMYSYCSSRKAGESTDIYIPWN